MSTENVPQLSQKPYGCDEPKPDKIFTQEELENFAGFYHSLLTVYVRLRGEGYTVRNGEFVPPKKGSKLTPA